MRRSDGKGDGDKVMDGDEVGLAELCWVSKRNR